MAQAAHASRGAAVHICCSKRGSGARRRIINTSGVVQTSPIASELARAGEYHPAENDGQEQHGEAGPGKGAPGSVPARENVFTEDPLAQVRGKEILADVPDGAGIIGAGAACYQRKGGQDFGERRMFFVKAQVELLQVADAGADVGHFVDGD
jgi:hypothetical protein